MRSCGTHQLHSAPTRRRGACRLQVMFKQLKFGKTYKAVASGATDVTATKWSPKPKSAMLLPEGSLNHVACVTSQLVILQKPATTPKKNQKGRIERERTTHAIGELYRAQGLCQSTDCLADICSKQLVAQRHTTYKYCNARTLRSGIKPVS